MRAFGIGMVATIAGLLIGASALAGDDHGKKAAIGKAAPQFSLQDQDGRTVNLSDYKGKIVVLEWFNNECPYVVKHYKEGHMNALASTYTGKGVVWLAVNTTKGKSNADNKAIAADWKINRPILNDASGEVGHAYGARTTPHMYIIDATGNLAYIGAIDDDRSADTAKVAGAKNYVAAALDELLSGSTVSVTETRPYGCSVKYAN